MALYTRIIGRRTLKPLVWNVVIQQILLGLFIFLTNFNIIHPLNWLYNWYSKFSSIVSWMYVFPLVVIVILLASASTEDYLKSQKFYPNRVSLILQALTLNNIVIGFLHLSIGFLIPWTYTSLIHGEYASFLYPCEYEDAKVRYCLSETRVFLVEGGLFISLIHFFQSHFLGTRYLKFPIAQLPKFILIKGQFLDTFKESIQWVLVPNLSFLLCYYLKIGSLNLSMSHSLGYEISEDRVDTLSGLLDFGLLTYFTIFSVLITVSLRFMELFSRIYLTERYSFPLSAPAEAESLTLPEALKKSDYPIIQHIAFLDLMLLSNHNKFRREEIFKLSSFGGHPHVWNSVKEGCTEVVLKFIDDLSDTASESPQLAPVDQTVLSPMRRNVPDYFEGYNRNITSPTSQKQTPKAPDFTLSLITKIKKSPIVLYFFGTRKDMKIRHTLRMCSPVKWACESLSFLSCHSLKEDQYGIVVNDLPDIINLLLHLKLNLDNLLKRTALATTLSSQDLENIAEATALKKSVKRSIYRIVNTFKQYISDLQLPKDLEHQLMPYIMYKE